MMRGVKYVLMQGATGSGKSYIASEICRRAIEKKKRVMFTVPRRELIRQMALTFEDFHLPFGYIASGYGYNQFAQSHICSTDTLKGRLDKVRPPDLAIIDETHFGAEGLDRIIQWLKASGSFIIGLSATPWKLSGQGLGCWYQEMVCGPSIRWLIDNKRLSEYRGFAPSTPDLSMISTVGGDYAKGQLADKMEQDRVLIGNAVSHYKKHADGRLNIAFCVSIKHSEIVTQSFRDAGVPAAHIDGKTPDDERARIIKAFAKRELNVLSNCELLTFGFDLASAANMPVTVESMSDLRPTKSLALQMQKWGRVLRYKTDPALIFDHANNFYEHGMPCEERPWTLADRERKGRAGSEKTIPVRTCMMCFFCHVPSPQCPACGYTYPIQHREIEQVEGELSEVEIKQNRRKRGWEESQCKSLEDWQALAKERGHKPYWARLRWQMSQKRKKDNDGQEIRL